VTKYRLFCEDVGGPGSGCFSGIRDIEALSPQAAVKTEAHWERSTGQRVIALPHSRKDLWPRMPDGKVPAEALRFR
jgi:hypothetical protein